MRFPFRSLTGSATLLLAALAAPVAASGQAVMTFLPVACATGASVNVTSPYSEAGFTLTTTGGSQFATWCADAAFETGYANYAGPGFFINTYGSDASLTKAGGGTFSINAIELAYLYQGTLPTENLTFTGYLSGGGTISQTFTIGPQVQFGTFMPFLFDASWMNLASVVFPVLPDYPNSYQFTNIVLNSSESTVPEPASMMLLGTGLVGVFGAARRRFSKTA
jgi:PEP-CTERM motif-containing protein